MTFAVVKPISVWRIKTSRFVSEIKQLVAVICNIFLATLSTLCALKFSCDKVLLYFLFSVNNLRLFCYLTSKWSYESWIRLTGNFMFLIRNSKLSWGIQYTSSQSMSTNEFNIYCIIIIPRLYSPLKVRVNLLTTGLTFICSQTKVKYHPTCLGMTCGQLGLIGYFFIILFTIFLFI